VGVRGEERDAAACRKGDHVEPVAVGRRRAPGGKSRADLETPWCFRGRARACPASVRYIRTGSLRTALLNCLGEGTPGVTMECEYRAVAVGGVAYQHGFCGGDFYALSAVVA
jgi:hypothetical protein